MQLAAMLLRDGLLRANEVAARVGYDSEAAFSRAFKRYTGRAPRAFRKRTVDASGGAPAPGGTSFEAPPRRRDAIVT